MPRIVTAAGAGSTLHTLDVPERQILVGMDGEQQRFWHHLLIQRVEGSKWITADPDGDVNVEDLAGEMVIPLQRAANFPDQGRPFLTFDALDEAEMAALRARAQTLADIHGLAAPPTALTGGAALWLISDPSHAAFGHEVTTMQLADHGSCEVRASVGLVRRLGVDGAAEWVTMERVTRTDQATWQQEKRTGAGRDPRLSTLPAVTGPEAFPLFREALAAAAASTEPNRALYEGPSAFAAVATAILRSGLEPQSFALQFIATSGANPRAAVVVEFGHLIYGLWALVCVDRLDPYRSAMAEHSSRRILQIQNAIRRSPKSPDFEGLDEYMRHSEDLKGHVTAPKFDAHIMERMKAESQILKQTRLQREEVTAEGKRRGGRNQPKNEEKPG